MSNRTIIMEIVAAFDNNDVDAIINLVTEDIEWNMVGENSISGKDNLRQFFADHLDMKMISSTKDHIIIDGNRGCVDGIVHCSNGKDKDFHMQYCDIYDIEHEKIKKITSYVINKK
jgi:ketosteroid isomerase-like protein